MEQGRVVGTGVALVLARESPLGSLHRAGTPEERGERRQLERGKAVEVALQTFADVEAAGEVERWGGNWHGTRVVDLRTDPTSTLLDIAAGAEIGDILGDLHIHDLDVSRFSFYAAPHRVVLSEALRERIQAAGWRL